MEHKLAIRTEQWHCVMTDFYTSTKRFIFHDCLNLMSRGDMRIHSDRDGLFNPSRDLLHDTQLSDI